jgi:hypothetical protein
MFNFSRQPAMARAKFRIISCSVMLSPLFSKHQKQKDCQDYQYYNIHLKHPHKLQRLINRCTPSGDSASIFHCFDKIQLILPGRLPWQLYFYIKGFAVRSMAPNICLTRNADGDSSPVFRVKVSDGVIHGKTTSLTESHNDFVL